MKIQIYKVKNRDSCVTEIIEVKSDTSTDTRSHFVPPFGNPEILLFVGQPKQIKNIPFKKGIIKGLYNNSQKVDFISNYHFLTVRLQPYGLKQLFNINAFEILNTVIDIESQSVSKALLSAINSSNSIEISVIKDLISCIERSAIHPVSPSTRAFIQLASNPEYKTIKALSSQNEIGLRTLQRNFKNETGLSPKEYLRIKRLNAIEQSMSQTADIFEIISKFDYSDQSHFIKDFKQLRNITPTEIIKKKLLLSDQLTQPTIIFV